MTDKKKHNDHKKHNTEISKPDEETLHTTDPQEHMEGPVSSVMQSIKEAAEKDDKEKSDEKNKK